MKSKSRDMTDTKSKSGATTDAKSRSRRRERDGIRVQRRVKVMVKEVITDLERFIDKEQIAAYQSSWHKQQNNKQT